MSYDHRLDSSDALAKAVTKALAESVLDNIVVSGEYKPVAAIFSLVLTGTGTIYISTLDALGVETLNKFVYTLTDSTSIVKTFMAETISQIKLTFPSTTTVTYIG